MSALTSLLARDQIVPLRKIEEALQKQVLSGGEIATVLLELDALAENTLAAYSAALFGLLPATREEVMRAPRDVVRLVPREVAEKHRLVPLGVDGTTLLCALAEPLAAGADSQLAFLVGHTIAARIVCDVRISAALTHHYGVEPTPRHRRLIERLRERDAGAVPYVAPPPTGKVSAGALSAIPQKARDRSSWLDEGDDDASTSSAGAFVSGRGSGAMGMPQSLPPNPDPPAPRVSELPVERERHTFPMGSDRVTDLGQAPPPGKPAGAAAPKESTASKAAPSQKPAPTVRDEPSRQALIPPSSALPRPAERPARTASDSSSSNVNARRHRGPLTPAAAMRELDEAAAPDDVLEVLFSFARQFFDYSAIFAIQDDVAEGREAYGPGASTDEIKAVRISLAVPGIIADARERRMPLVAALDTKESDRALAAELGRPGAGPALVLPIVIKQRVVLCFYADRAGDTFEPSDVPELLALVPRVTAALERIILQKKKSRDANFARPEESSARGDLKAAVRGATEAARSEAPKDRRSLDRWGPSERRSVPPPAAETTSASQARTGAVASRPPPESPPRSLADTALDSPEPPAPAAPPVAAASIARAREALGPRGILGIPRSAPPPPRSHVPGLETPVLAEFPNRDTLPEGYTASALASARVGVAARAVVARAASPSDDDEPNISITAGDDDEPEISVGDDDETGHEHSDGADEPALDTSTTKNQGVATASAYLVRDASVEVVAPQGRRTISSRPPPPNQGPPNEGPPNEEPALLTKRRPSNRPPSIDAAAGGAGASDPPRARRDPRAEDEGAVPGSEVVRVKSGRGASLAPPTGKPSSPPRAASRDVPSVIVDMGETVTSLVVDLQHAGPDDERALVEALLRLGEAALPVLTQAFPGPLWFDRRRPHRRVPRGRDVSAICRAFFAFGLRATPYVASLVGANSAERRYYALLLAGEMIHPSMIEAISGRLFDEDDGVRKLAQDVFPRFRGIAGYDEQLVVLRRAARIRGKVPRRRTDALAALGAAREVGSLDLLVELLEDEDQNVSRAAHVVLVALTCEDLGPSMRKWAQWIDKNRGRHRIEWLIDALVSGDEALRTSAGDELKALTQQYFGFHPSTPRREREVAQSKYRAWWQAEGKKQLG